MKSSASFLLALILLAGCATEKKRQSDSAAAGRAIDFLSKEVPAWHRENGCYSCHNNGDGARALYEAKRMGFRIPDSALADSSDWLNRPNDWEHNQGDPGFSDQRLANLQFAATLLSSVVSRVATSKAFVEARKKISMDQGADGAWHIDEESRVGSPTTYGPNLATFMGSRVLGSSSDPEISVKAAKAREWLLRAPIQNIPAAAVFLLSFGNDAATTAKTELCLKLIKKGQTSEGGWGPYSDAPVEVFDTALVLLALSELTDRDTTGMTSRGRQFLITTQEPDGSWPATTRPSGGISYAQKISTTAWALQALLKTERKIN